MPIDGVMTIVTADYYHQRRNLKTDRTKSTSGLLSSRLARFTRLDFYADFFRAEPSLCLARNCPACAASDSESVIRSATLNPNPICPNSSQAQAKYFMAGAHGGQATTNGTVLLRLLTAMRLQIVQTRQQPLLLVPCTRPYWGKAAAKRFSNPCSSILRTRLRLFFPLRSTHSQRTLTTA
ncbi:hypothetical protein BD309DRAFT_952785 [Dichomitus squalens]|nr:hypothetical protein BD309DRAFT_952785 [Dichomitus squalens]